MVYILRMAADSECGMCVGNKYKNESKLGFSHSENQKELYKVRTSNGAHSFVFHVLSYGKHILPSTA